LANRATFVSLSYGNRTEMPRPLILPLKPDFPLLSGVESCFLQLVSKTSQSVETAANHAFHDTKFTLRSSPGYSSTETRQGGVNPA
jgi:hypothetical protein